MFADVLDFKSLQEKVVTYQIDTIIHFSALLSAIGEQNTPLAMRVNIEGLHNILELSRQYRLKLFVPSTIGKCSQSEVEASTGASLLKFQGMGWNFPPSTKYAFSSKVLKIQASTICYSIVDS